MRSTVDWQIYKSVQSTICTETLFTKSKNMIILNVSKKVSEMLCITEQTETEDLAMPAA